jgi:hypothetical protein
VISCDVCGSQFQPVKPWQKRCSKKCSSIANNARRRADLAVKMCRTCRQDLPLDDYLPAHRSCIACERLYDSGRKKCHKCKQVKPLADFHRRPNREHAYDGNCKACRSHDSKQRNALPEKQARYRELRYRRLYGVGLAQVEAMQRQQKGTCAVCGLEPSGPFHVDHDHKTGKVRELLCLHCNALLGHCSDSIEVLKQAIAYLERHSQ